MKISFLTKSISILCFTEVTKWGPASAQCRELAEVSRRPGVYFWTLGKTAAVGGWGTLKGQVGKYKGKPKCPDVSCQV